MCACACVYLIGCRRGENSLVVMCVGVGGV
jgi:hypothetical protein